MDERLQAIVDDFGNKVINISEEMSDKHRYRELIETVFEYLRMGFEIKELREAPVYYRFKDGGPVYSLQLRRFLTNLMFWHPMLTLGAIDDLDEGYIVDATKLSSGYIETYFNENIIKPYRDRVSNKTLNKIIHDVIFNLNRISTEFNIILGLTINIESFIDVANRNERFNEIIHTKIDDSMQPSEIEAHLNALMKEEIEILKEEDNVLKPMLRAGAGIKNKQLAEMSINVGLKPDLSGNTIPIPINTNLVTGGLQNVTNYYIDSIGGRKSLIANRTVNLLPVLL